MNTTQTPETDFEQQKARDAYEMHREAGFPAFDSAPYDHARKLELERNEARADAAVMRNALGNALNLRRALCFNGCETCASPLGCTGEYVKQFESALSTNAGRELLAEVERLRNIVSLVETELSHAGPDGVNYNPERDPGVALK